VSFWFNSEVDLCVIKVNLRKDAKRHRNESELFVKEKSKKRAQFTILLLPILLLRPLPNPLLPQTPSFFSPPQAGW
jgi:hypothetical protein